MSRSTRFALALAVTLLIGGAAPGLEAQALPLAPDLVGAWTSPFEEGGAGQPRCVTAADGRIICKPAAVSTAVLPDGRVLYANGLESTENAKEPVVPALAQQSRNSAARLLDLRSGTPAFAVPTPASGGARNPNIDQGHASEEDPLGLAGVPGRPGDGLVGSAAGELGVPSRDPSSSPDDVGDNDGDVFCSDITSLPDGRVLIAGGTDWYNEPAVLQRDQGDPVDAGAGELEGLRSSRIFDPQTNSFSQSQPMKYGRWYPTLVGLADGRVLVASGTTKLVKATQGSQVRRTETFDPDSASWRENYSGPASETTLPQFARLYLMPNGKVLYSGVGQMWGPFGESADQALFGLQQLFDPATATWEVVGLAPLGARSGAFEVMLPLSPPYDSATVLTFGGTLGPPPGGYLATALSTLTTVDRRETVTNTSTGSLHTARWFPSGVVLPDGTVLALGGADRDSVVEPGAEIAVRSTELYDPQTGQWTELAPHARDRGYHNSALLLPDGRVLIGGNSPLPNSYGPGQRDLAPGFANNDKDPSFEAFSPPYLFRGPRPTISSAPAGVRYGEKFAVGTPEAGEVDSVLLVRLPSPQHVLDADQRALRLEFTVDADDRLSAVAPPDGAVAPPGFYYLFVNRKTAKGPVPSVARIVHLGDTSNPSEAPQPFPDDAPAPTGGSATPDQDTSTAATAGREAYRRRSS